MKQLTFDEWLIYVFDRPVNGVGNEWYWDADADWWRGSPAEIIQYLTQTFENAAVVLRPYSDAQLNQGLWYIASNGCSDYMFALLDADVPWPARQRCIRSIHQLFEQCFAARCTPHLSHLDEPDAGPLNMACYMWWDLIPIIGQPDDPQHKEIDREILAVLESSLQLDSIACRESALHGLGHWQPYYPHQIDRIIDTFLKTQTGIRAELRNYAISASRGCVL